MAAARLAEDVGFDGVWTYDHLSGVSLDGRWAHDPWTLLAAIASSTHRVKLGPLVANMTVRHPAHVALAAASLQDLSSGRAMLGVGAGAGPESPYSEELKMMGIVPRSAVDRRAIVEDAIGVMKALWAGEADFGSEHFTLSGATAFLKPDRAIPVIVGSNGPKMCELAGRVADGVNLHWWESDLDVLIERSREKAQGRRFLVTVEAQLSREWMPHAKTVHSRLDQMDVDRLMLAWHGADGLDAIRGAAGLIP